MRKPVYYKNDLSAGQLDVPFQRGGGWDQENQSMTQRTSANGFIA